MAAKNVPVEYVLYPDEGHGFARPVSKVRLGKQFRKDLLN